MILVHEAWLLKLMVKGMLLWMLDVLVMMIGIIVADVVIVDFVVML